MRLEMGGFLKLNHWDYYSRQRLSHVKAGKLKESDCFLKGEASSMLRVKGVWWEEVAFELNDHLIKGQRFCFIRLVT